MTQNDAQQTEFTVNTQVLVIGAGLSGLASAETIAEQGYEVLILDQGTRDGAECCYDPEIDAFYRSLRDRVQEHASISLKSGARLKQLAGFSGNFQAELEQDAGREQLDVGAVVLATGYRCLPLFEQYTLRPGKTVLSIKDLEKLLADEQGKARIKNGSGASIAFLSGFGDEGSPVATERVLKNAMAVQDLEQCQAYVLAGNVKVGAAGMERLFTRARNQGVTCIKPQEPPETSLQDDTLHIAYTDPILRQDVILNPDCIVLDERIAPDAENDGLRELLGIDADDKGFLQSGNVHRLPVRTNREGIFVSGTSAAVKTPDQALDDAADVALQVADFLGTGTVQVTGSKAVVDEGRCVICLTCYRCCPHGAIAWESKKAVISPIACQGCGICAAECPMDAIQLQEYSDDAMSHAVQEQIKTAEQPSILAFCCRNSAFEAARTARKMGLDLPDQLRLIEVPCAGKIDVETILRAFTLGAGAVVVLACHEGNCQSERGNTYAGWRIREMQKRLEALGFDDSRLVFATLASNMPREFARITRAAAGINP